MSAVIAKGTTLQLTATTSLQLQQAYSYNTPPPKIRFMFRFIIFHRPTPCFKITGRCMVFEEPRLDIGSRYFPCECPFNGGPFILMNSSLDTSGTESELRIVSVTTFNWLKPRSRAAVETTSVSAANVNGRRFSYIILPPVSLNSRTSDNQQSLQIIQQ